jgi:hypothetical protein
MRQRIPALAAGAAASLALLVGCATTANNQPAAPTGTAAQQAALERYSAYAGPPIDHFTWLGHYYSWEGLGKDQLVVFTTPSDAYLLKVSGPCTDLKFVTSIGLTSTGSTVYSRLDSVKVRHWRCPIAEIRKVDYKRMRADMRTAAEKAKRAS